MAANLGLVVHAAERDAPEVAVQRARDRPAERGLAHSGRSDEAEDRPLHIRLEPADREVVQDAVLDLLEVVVILVENLPGLGDVHFAARRFRPGQNREPLNVVARERVVGGHGRHARKAVELFQRLFLGLLGHTGGFDLFAQLFDILLALVLFAELLLDGLHLLAQIVVALRLLDLVLHFGLNLVAQLLDFELLGQMLVDPLQTHRNIGSFEELLLVGGRQERQ